MIIRSMTGLLFLSGVLVLVWLTRENNRLDEDISRLEGELGLKQAKPKSIPVCFFSAVGIVPASLVA